MYFHTDNATVIWTLAEAITSAEADGRRLRINVDEAGNIQYKIGEGMWSGPIRSTPDPYRDVSEVSYRPEGTVLPVNAAFVAAGRGWDGKG